MSAFHTQSPCDGGLTNELMESRLARETRARIEAERLLEDKSRRLYSANKALEKVAENLEGQRQQLNTILDHTQAAIFLVNENMKVVQSNRAANEMFLLSDDDLLDLSVVDLFERSNGMARVVRRRLKKSDEEIQLEGDAIMRDGGSFPFECGVTSIARPDGRKWTVWIVSDITRRRKDEMRRAALEKELSQAQKMEALGTLASGVAHEINTPVQYVGDNLRFLGEAVSDLSSLLSLAKAQAPAAEITMKMEDIDADFLIAEMPEAIEQSVKGLEQVARIVKAIKEFSHPGRETVDVVDLNEAIETTLTVTRNQWKYLAKVETDLAAELPKAPCNPGDINQVLLNMIVNAADAISENETPGLGTIRIATREVDGCVEICISDTGVGMPPEVMERMFDPFFTTKDVGKGTGQGLAISYNIIRQKHNGEILCNSVPGEGTTFTLRLPITPDAVTQGDIS